MRSIWTLQASHKVFQEDCKITKKTLIGSTKTKEEVKMSSFFNKKKPSPFKGYQVW
jgi:hypothetical protein